MRVNLGSLDTRLFAGLLIASIGCMNSGPSLIDRYSHETVPSALTICRLRRTISVLSGGGDDYEPAASPSGQSHETNLSIATAETVSSLGEPTTSPAAGPTADSAVGSAAGAPEEVPTVLRAGCVVIAGGRGNASFSPIQAAACWDAAAGSWSALPQLRHCRRSGEMALLGGCLYVCGGAPPPPPPPPSPLLPHLSSDDFVRQRVKERQSEQSRLRL
jgi:hypothetical protein